MTILAAVVQLQIPGVLGVEINNQPKQYGHI